MKALLDSDNPYQEMTRAKVKCDLILEEIKVASILPNDKQIEIFTENKIRSLVRQILAGNSKGLHTFSKIDPIYEGKDKEIDTQFNRRTLGIAFCLVEEGIKIFIEQFENDQKEYYNPEDPALKLLNETVKYCNSY